MRFLAASTASFLLGLKVRRVDRDPALAALTEAKRGVALEGQGRLG
jgi:hypothetical protein